MTPHELVGGFDGLAIACGAWSLCLVKSLSGMTRVVVGKWKRADGRASDLAVACYPVAVDEASAA